MQQSKKNTLFYLGLILLVSVGPIMVAYVLINYYPEMLGRISHKNFGTLVKPQVVLNTDGLVSLDIDKPDTAIDKLPALSLKHYWTYVTLSPSVCNNICLRNLQYQLRVRASQRQYIYLSRVLYIVTDTVQLKTLMTKAKNFRDVQFALIKPESRDAFLAQFKLTQTDRPASQQRIYLIDPPGNWMMYYNPYKGSERNLLLPTGMKKDLTKLIKTNKYPYPKIKPKNVKAKGNVGDSQ
ncbi:hypothetical protein MNBD_GAMMA12-1893 [hydrothermal vent metagenome]|uniref:Thioredoxin domain-containing protein n=1 Tax=hydrothermal vent metagenome TaxID=652676 RepID=A0A3B0Z9D8_9ZZZZ